MKTRSRPCLAGTDTVHCGLLAVRNEYCLRRHCPEGHPDLILMEYAGVSDETTGLSDEVCMRTPPPLLKAGAGSIGIECESAVNEECFIKKSGRGLPLFLFNNVLSITCKPHWLYTNL